MENLDNDASEVLLGGLIKKNEFNAKYLEKSEYFPSKIGGKPAWLDPVNLPTDNQIICKNCKCVMSFLLQIYAPKSAGKENGHDGTFHRMIYLFVCRDCKNVFRAFRCQLSLKNQYYSIYEPSEYECDLENNESSNNLNYLIKNSKSMENIQNFNDEVHQLCDKFDKDCTTINEFDKLIRRDDNVMINYPALLCDICGLPSGVSFTYHKRCFLAKNFKRIEEVFPEYLITIFDEEIDKDKKNNDNELEYERRLAEKYYEEVKGDESEDKMNDSNDENYEESDLKKDRSFNNFMERINLSGFHVIRYCHRGKPLYMYEDNRVKENRIPKCLNCGSERYFEFEVLPNLITILENKMIEYAVVLIYTCSNHCDVDIKQDQTSGESVYLEEYVYVQPEIL